MTCFVNFQLKYFKTTEKLRLAVSGSLSGAKHFSVVFFPFDVFDEKRSHIHQILAYI